MWACVCVEWELVVWGGSTQTNKWQNWQSQSWIRPPDTAQRRLVLQQEPCDTSPRLFSVNSALSRLFILPCSLMSQKTLPSQPPTPPHPLTYTYNESTVYCRYIFLFDFFFLFSLVWSWEDKSCLLYKVKTSPFHCSCFFVCFLGGRGLQQICLKERWDSILPLLLDFVLMVEHVSDADWPLSFSQWFLFYCSFNNLQQWRWHYRKMVCILLHSVAVRPLYHSTTVVKSRLLDSKSFWLASKNSCNR